MLARLRCDLVRLIWLLVTVSSLDHFSSLDLDDFDGVDSPRRLYNRKPSPEFSKTEEEMVWLFPLILSGY